MIIRIPDLGDEGRQVDFRETAGALNELLAASAGSGEHRFEQDLGVHAEIHRHGSDIYLSGTLDGAVHGNCRRCLDDFDWPLHRDFKFLIVKEGEGEILEDDTGVDHYEGDELDLGRLVREQALLGLDDSVICSDDCRGLCPGCGANRNHAPCTCVAEKAPAGYLLGRPVQQKKT